MSGRSKQTDSNTCRETMGTIFIQALPKPALDLNLPIAANGTFTLADLIRKKERQAVLIPP